MLDSNQVSSQSIDHMGLVAATIHDLGIIQAIDKLIPVSTQKGARLTMGERVAGMILNGLGFIDTRLYLFAEFLSDKPLDVLIRKGIEAEDFTDDALGRCLDAIHAEGVETMFSNIAYPIALQHGLMGSASHMDTSTLSLHGAYSESQSKDAESSSDNLPTPVVNHGYSKAKRPDLKQVVLNMATTGAAGFPIWMEAHSGNASDQVVLHESFQRMESFVKSMKHASNLLYVADSAAYSSCVKQTEKILWLSRVPERTRYITDLLEMPDDHYQWEEVGNGYKTCVIGCTHQEVKQYWCIVSSKQAYKRETQTFEKQLSNLDASLESSLWHLTCQEFGCHTDAEVAAQAFIKKLKYHEMEYEIISKEHYVGKGRPKKNVAPDRISFSMKGKLMRNEAVIAIHMRRKGRFILATNDINHEIIQPSDMLPSYKEQAKTESGFAFIKNDDFQISSVCLKNPERIAALLMVMTLCLMVYSVAQHKLRKALKAAEKTIPDNKGKETDNPTLARVFRLFIGIQLLMILSPEIQQNIVINLTPLRIKIIELFGYKAMEIYGLLTKAELNMNKPAA
ncbi:MAG: IS1634 family transposase [Nitrospinaceae bacterium]